MPTIEIISGGNTSILHFEFCILHFAHLRDKLNLKFRAIVSGGAGGCGTRYRHELPAGAYRPSWLSGLPDKLKFEAIGMQQCGHLNGARIAAFYRKSDCVLEISEKS